MAVEYLSAYCRSRLICLNGRPPTSPQLDGHLWNSSGQVQVQLQEQILSKTQCLHITQLKAQRRHFHSVDDDSGWNRETLGRGNREDGCLATHSGSWVTKQQAFWAALSILRLWCSHYGFLMKFSGRRKNSSKGTEGYQDSDRDANFLSHKQVGNLGSIWLYQKIAAEILKVFTEGMFWFLPSQN